jgi:hypothetical protein
MKELHVHWIKIEVLFPDCLPPNRMSAGIASVPAAPNGKLTAGNESWESLNISINQLRQDRRWLDGFSGRIRPYRAAHHGGRPIETPFTPSSAARDTHA